MAQRPVHRRETVDLDRLRDYIEIQAKQSGARVRARRKALGLRQHDLARLIDPAFPFQTISKIEMGQIIPREYLRAAIAMRLCCEVEELWPYPRRADLMKVA